MPKFSILIASLLALQLPFSLQEDVPVDPVFGAIPPMSEYVPSDPSFPKDFRILDCWQCYQAQGKFCKDKDHQLLHHHVQSTKAGNGFCCKTDYNEGYCKDGNTHGDSDGEKIEIVCSPPSFVKDVTPAYKWSAVLTDNTRNHQHFAFCPRTSQQSCGFPNARKFFTDHDMALKAKPEKGVVSVTKMAYHPQGRNRVTGKIVGNEDAEYDACYYEVQMDQSILEKWDPTQLNVKITTKSPEIDAFIYQGKSRKESTKSVVTGNVNIQAGQSFKLKPDEGFLIVAYPRDDSEGDFGFEFWVDATLKPEPKKPGEEEEKKPDENKEEEKEPEKPDEEKKPEPKPDKPEEEKKPEPKPDQEDKKPEDKPVVKKEPKKPAVLIEGENFEEIQDQIKWVIIGVVVPLFAIMLIGFIIATCLYPDQVKEHLMTNFKVIDQNYGYLKKHDLC